MEVHNFKNGVKVVHPLPNVILSKFYWKNLARVSYDTSNGFSIFDPTEWQNTAVFKRTDVTALSDNGAPVPIPATDLALFTLLTNYFYVPPLNSAPSSLEVVDFFGSTALFNESDKGKAILSQPPTAVKNYTIPAGLSKGWHCEVYKMYNGGSLTFVAGAGMTLWGATLAMGAQYSKMEILVTTPTTAVLNLHL